MRRRVRVPPDVWLGLVGFFWCTGMAQADADIDTEGVTPKRLKVRRPQETAEEPIAHNEPSTGSGIGEAA